MSDVNEGVRPIGEIASFHAHVYYDTVTTRAQAQALRERIGERFSVTLGGWHDAKVGPHDEAMYQVAFQPAEFARFVPWLMINRQELAVLIHPNTGRPKTDHLTHAMWLGEILGVNAGSLPDDDASDPEIVPNTTPTIQP